ncbi:MAG: DUF5615 family PIN-like protein [Magnetococcus sp. YQC-5]
MRVLLDTCIWGGVLKVLKATGIDAEWIGEWPKDPGDEEILALAYKQGRILVTLDKDFGELAVVRKQPHAGIVRLVNIPSRQQGQYCLYALNSYSNELHQGGMVTINTERVRIRLADFE